MQLAPPLTYRRVAVTDLDSVVEMPAEMAVESVVESPAPEVQEVSAPAEGVKPVAEVEAKPVDAVRSAAGRLGAQRVQELAKLGREYEREHGLKAGRQRRRQLIQLGRRYEAEHGLAAPKPRKRKRGDAWTEFLVALARVVKPAHRPAVEQLVAALRQPKLVPPPAAA
jgi:hypothetical protein